MRPAFTKACEGREWSFELLHTDEATAAQLAAAGPLPAVVQGSADRWVRMLGPSDIERLACSPDALLDAIEDRLAELTMANCIDPLF